MKFPIADWHVHPNLKTYGHSFDKTYSEKSNLWKEESPGFFKKNLNRVFGLTRFYQATYSSLHKGGVKIAFVSLYPFEKGFFVNGALNGPVTAFFANLVTGIGYRRIRHLQKQMDYFEELEGEMRFLMKAERNRKIKGEPLTWEIADTWNCVSQELLHENSLIIIPTIEGSHVLNSGLGAYGKATKEKQILRNLDALKNWRHTPFFITFAHNFANDFCGHAPSLEKLGPLVNQKPQIGGGFTELGWTVVKSLLDEKNGRPILLDLKHMSLQSRKELYEWNGRRMKGKSPLLVSHGAVTGCSWQKKGSFQHPFFCEAEINFYDEDILEIMASGGFFALQLDANRLGNAKAIRKRVFGDKTKAIEKSCQIIWAHLKHIGELLDSRGVSAWDQVGLGSDFDGTINPLEGIWTAEDFPSMAQGLLQEIERYLDSKNPLTDLNNKYVEPEDILNKFLFGNTLEFLKKHYSHPAFAAESEIKKAN
ncbi:MAG TPA: membrane dipeptidase [Algoriphagus sp.]|nr:membrane dipeptidase [Algoriphagus sp.]